MMLFNLAIKNIKKSFKDYAIYFLTIILGVAIFYVFNAIDSQTAMLNISKRTDEIIKLMTNILSGVSVFVTIVLAFLIIYANKFLMKRRKKEFAIYLTLGMSKSRISLILFLEMLFIGIISLSVGLLLGVFLSQIMSVIVANMFRADLSNFTFVFSKSSFMKTLIYFEIMYLVVMLFNTISISKNKLIDLLQSNKKSEKVKLKNSVVCTIIFIISICILSYSYYSVTVNFEKLLNGMQILVPIVLGLLSTFLIFWSLSGLILKILKKNKNLYYKDLNSFTVKQISSKINTTVFSVTIICLMLFITICIFSSSLSMKNSLNKNLIDYVPRDIEIGKSIHLDEEDNAKLTVTEVFSKYDIDYQKYLKNIVEFSLYSDENITLKTTLGDYYEIAKKKDKFLMYDDNVLLMKNSDYNNVADSFNLKKVHLKDNEYALVGNYKNMLTLKEEALKMNTKIVLDNKEYFPKYSKAISGFYEMSGNEVEIGFIVLPDNALENAKMNKSYLIADYNGDKDELEEKFNQIIKNDLSKEAFLSINTKKDIEESAVGLGALVTFIGLYLGIIFLISCAAILALKELSESSDNVEKFRILKRIGADEEKINKALFIQIAVFFAFPLFLAIIHSVFGIMFCNIILKTAGVEFNLLSVFTTALFIILIYGSYFITTYLCSKNIIREK